MKNTLAVAFALCAFATSARTEDVVVWRGETHTFILRDYLTVGSAPEGIAVKTGTAKEVRYLDRPFGTHYRTMADRVVWGSDEQGVKIASVSAAADVKPGTCEVGDLRVKVLDRVLPPAKEWKYVLDLWQHPWAVARYAKVEPFSSAHYAAMKPLWELLADAGQKSLTVTILDLPWNHQCYDAYHSMVRHILRKDGSWAFDYRVFDEYVAFGRSCGIGPWIACYTMCPWDYAVTWEDEDGGVHTERAVPGTEAFERYWGPFLTDFAAHLKEKGWLGDTWLCMDERKPSDVQNICRFVAEKAPGLRTSLAGNRAPSEFKGIRIDHACFGLSHLTDELIAEAAARREQGMVTSFYVCCGPEHPNTMCANELEEAFWLGVYPAMAGLDGFLRWAWNSWPQDPIRDASCTGIGKGWPAGDSFLVYPDGSPSLRFLELRNGIVAAEKLRILKEQDALKKKDFASIAAKFDRKAAMENTCDFTKLRASVQKIVNKGR